MNFSNCISAATTSPCASVHSTAFWNRSFAWNLSKLLPMASTPASANTSEARTKSGGSTMACRRPTDTRLFDAVDAAFSAV